MTGSVAQGQRQRDEALNYFRTFSPTRWSQNKDCPQTHSQLFAWQPSPPEVSDTEGHRDLANIACQSLSHRTTSGDSLSSKDVMLRKPSQGWWKTWKMQRGVEWKSSKIDLSEISSGSILQLPLCRSCDRFVFVFLVFLHAVT